MFVGRNLHLYQVPGSAGVRSRPHPQRHLGEWAEPLLAESREEEGILRLGEVRQLVEGDVLELGRLVLELVVLVLEVAEGDLGSRRERPLLVAVVPRCAGVGEVFLRTIHERARLGQVCVSAAEDEGSKTGNVNELQCPIPERLRLAAAASSAVEEFAGFGVQEKLLLLRVRPEPLAAVRKDGEFLFDPVVIRDRPMVQAERPLPGLHP